MLTPTHSGGAEIKKSMQSIVNNSFITFNYMLTFAGASTNPSGFDSVYMDFQNASAINNGSKSPGFEASTIEVENEKTPDDNIPGS